MTEGQKSRTARALACVLAALLSVAAFSPALASAQSGASEEYQLDPNIPNPDETEQTLSGGGSDEQGGTDAGAAAGSSTGSGTPGDSGGATGGEGKGDKSQSGTGSANAGQGSGATEVATAANQAPSVDTAASDDGGAPVLLILLAVVAAVCTGVALWRMRREPEDPGRPLGAEPTGSTASESHSA